MKVEEFIASYKPNLQEYCPCIIDREGEVYECEEGHLEALIQLSGKSDILSEIPQNLSPLYYMTDKMRCVVVDYENQIYSGTLSKKQRHALLALEGAGKIRSHLIDIGGNIAL
jgi:hypothetical protein